MTPILHEAHTEICKIFQKQIVQKNYTQYIKFLTYFPYFMRKHGLMASSVCVHLFVYQNVLE